MKRLLALALLVTPAVAGEPQVLSDAWQVLRILGADHGYVHMRVVRRDEIIETTVESRVVIKRGGVEMKVEQLQTTEERADDGSLVRMHSVQKMSDWDVEADIRFAGTKAIKVTTIAGKANESTQECGTGLVGPYWTERMTANAAYGFQEGTKIKARTYLADLGGPTDVTLTVGGKEEVELLDGKKEKLIRTEATLVGFKQIAWVDATGRIQKTRFNVGGMEMETFLTTERRARGAVETPTEALPDAFELSLLAPLHQIPYPRRLDRATYRIRAKEEMPDLADSRQVVEETGTDGAILLRVDRQVPAEGNGGRRPLASPPEGIAVCLAPSSMIQSDAPELRKIASDVVGSEEDAWKAAQKLERWVYENLTKKGMGVGFASALEVCRNREGDCTEHAVFLCALCRAAGIPSRVLMGLVCIGNAFGGHAWNEVWIEGNWYALDATLGQGSVDPTHLTLARMSMEDAATAEQFLGLIRGLGNLEIDPVEVVLDGKRLRPAEDAGKIEGDRFESRLWGIAFTKPEGFEFDPADRKASMTARIMEIEGKTASGKRLEIGIEATDGAVWEMVRKAVKDAKSFDLDGRPALRVAKDDRQAVYALVDGGVFTFEMQPAEGDAETAAFEKLLASVDFDVK